MFEVGFTEIVLIFGIALLVLGPARLPKLAADIGRWAGRARSMARQLRNQLEQETQFDPLADTKPAAPAQSHTIHSPAPDTAPGVVAGYVVQHVERRLPRGAGTARTATPDTHSSPAETIADEPKPG